MGKIILSAEMGAKFMGQNEKQELRDEQGNLLGYFEPLPTPPIPPKRKFEAWGPFSAEEVERALTQKKEPGRTLDEIFREHGHQ